MRKFTNRLIAFLFFLVPLVTQAQNAVTGKVLDEKGKLIKVHGGALSHAFNDITYPSKKIYSQDIKKVIGEKAAGLIKDGMFVLTGGGTTVIEMAR